MPSTSVLVPLHTSLPLPAPVVSSRTRARREELTISHTPSPDSFPPIETPSPQQFHQALRGHADGPDSSTPTPTGAISGAGRLCIAGRSGGSMWEGVTLQNFSCRGAHVEMLILSSISERSSVITGEEWRLNSSSFRRRDDEDGHDVDSEEDDGIKIVPRLLRPCRYCCHFTCNLELSCPNLSGRHSPLGSLVDGPRPMWI